MLSSLIFWKILYGCLFLGLLLLFGNLFWSMFDLFQKTKDTRLQYLFSTLLLLILFSVLRMMNESFNVFMNPTL